MSASTFVARSILVFLISLAMSHRFLFACSAPLISITEPGDGDKVVLFDVPAILEAKYLRTPHLVPSNESGAKEPETSVFQSVNHRLIVITVPVTSEISPAEQGNIDAFRFDVFWNRNPYPISDYAPRTQTTSEISGTIEIDQSTEKHHNYELDLAGSYPPFASGNAHLGGQQREVRNLRFSEIPQHEILVAAGTVRRGTGAFFRFHPSRSDTLEGGRDLLLAFRVPYTWRGGILQVECTALGSRKFLGIKEPFEFQRAFVVPIYLQLDEEAEQVAVEFARREQQLRQQWRRSKTKHLAARSGNLPLDSFFKISSRTESNPFFSQEWIHSLILSSDRPLERYRRQLPLELADAAEEFVKSRADLTKLSR